jgi:hypothetical protein
MNTLSLETPATSCICSSLVPSRLIRSYGSIYTQLSLLYNEYVYTACTIVVLHLDFQIGFFKLAATIFDQTNNLKFFILWFTQYLSPKIKTQ